MLLSGRMDAPFLYFQGIQSADVKACEVIVWSEFWILENPATSITKITLETSTKRQKKDQEMSSARTLTVPEEDPSLPGPCSRCGRPYRPG